MLDWRMWDVGKHEYNPCLAWVINLCLPFFNEKSTFILVMFCQVERFGLLQFFSGRVQRCLVSFSLGHLWNKFYNTSTEFFVFVLCHAVLEDSASLKGMRQTTGTTVMFWYVEARDRTDSFYTGYICITHCAVITVQNRYLFKILKSWLSKVV